MADLQHYVPRFLLRNFARGKSPQIYVYDKSTDKRFRTNVKNVAAEGGFYDLTIDDQTLSVEPALAHLEGAASLVIRKLVSSKRLNELAPADVPILATFLGVQFVRTKEHRIRFEHLGEMLKAKLREMGATEENVIELTRRADNIDEEKLVGLRSLHDVNQFIPHFLSKTWVLYETDIRHPFYISDNPIVLHNDVDHKPYGNLGLAVPGIQIYLPLSSTLCLGLLCPTIADEFKTGYETIKSIDRTKPGAADTIMKNPVAARAFCEGLVNGTPIPVINDSVTMMNSLQVAFSSRYVYCELDSFALATRMIQDNASLRQGLRPRTD